MARFVVASAVMVFFFGSSCGGMNTRPDGGSSVSLVGGGTSGTGTGGGSSGGGSAGGGTGGGSGGGSGGGTGGGAASMDGGTRCLQFQAINWNPPAGMASGEYSLVQDGGVGVNFTGIVSQVTAGTQTFFITVDARLINFNPSVPPSLPLSGTFESLTPSSVVVPRSFFGVGCDMGGNNCQLDFISRRGTYSVTAATPNAAAGTFVGSFTSVRYDQIDLTQGRLVPDGGCVELDGFTFNTAWP